MFQEGSRHLIDPQAKLPVGQVCVMEAQGRTFWPCQHLDLDLIENRLRTRKGSFGAVPGHLEDVLFHFGLHRQAGAGLIGAGKAAAQYSLYTPQPALHTGRAKS
ncbi:MAG: hypothetical protein IPN59_17550 [Holophaga sp.]|nr:hypothetical protein [Holophaga sp.]